MFDIKAETGTRQVGAQLAIDRFEDPVKEHPFQSSMIGEVLEVSDEQRPELSPNEGSTWPCWHEVRLV